MSNDTTNPSSDTEPTQNGRARGKTHQRMHAHPALSLTSKIVVTVVGTLVVLAGIVMMVTPGPAFLMIPLGLAILAIEWDWANRWLEKAKDQARKAEAMDPKVRRRRMLLTGLATVVVVGAVVGYVAVYDWPSLAVDSWNWVQGIAGWAPELPGM